MDRNIMGSTGASTRSSLDLSHNPGASINTQARLARSRVLVAYFRNLSTEIRLKIYKHILSSTASVEVKTYFANTAFELNWHRGWLRSKQVDTSLVKQLQVIKLGNVRDLTPPSFDAGVPSQPDMQSAFVDLIRILPDLEEIGLYTGPGGVFEWWLAADEGTDVDETPTTLRDIAGWAEHRMMIEEMAKLSKLKVVIFHAEWLETDKQDPVKSVYFQVCEEGSGDPEGVGPRGYYRTGASLYVRSSRHVLHQRDNGRMGWRLI